MAVNRVLKVLVLGGFLHHLATPPESTMKHEESWSKIWMILWGKKIRFLWCSSRGQSAELLIITQFVCAKATRQKKLFRRQ